MAAIFSLRDRLLYGEVRRYSSPMGSPMGYVREISSIKAEIKRLAEHTKQLRIQAKKTEAHLYAYMVRNNLEEYEGFKQAKLKPKPKNLRKSKAQKRSEGVTLLHQIGVPDPETFYDDFVATQKPKPPTDEGEADDEGGEDE